MSAKNYQEGVEWKDAEELKDYLVDVLNMKDDDFLEEAAKCIYDNGGTRADYLCNIDASYLIQVGVNVFVAQGLANKLKKDAHGLMII